MTRNINDLKTIHRYLQPDKKLVVERSYDIDIIEFLKDMTKGPLQGVPFEKIIRSLALNEIASAAQISTEVQNYESAIAQRHNGKTLSEIIKDSGIEKFSANIWRDPSPPQVFDLQMRNAADLFIKVMRGLKQQMELQARKLNTPVEIIIDKKSLLDPKIFALRSQFRTNDIDWFRPPGKPILDFSTSDIQSCGMKFISACGISSEAVEIHFCDLPFWGLEFNLELSKKAAVICGKPAGIAGLSTLIHELGHAIDCVTWRSTFSEFYFREPAMTETYAVMAQRLLENSDFYIQILGISAKHGNEIAKHYLNNKNREFAYMFVLMDLDRHFWSQDEITIDNCAEVYRKSCLAHFGFLPPSPYGFCAEQIHYLYPNYMANYFLAELFATSILPTPTTIDAFNRNIRLERKLSISAFLPDLDQLAAHRIAEISGANLW